MKKVFLFAMAIAVLCCSGCMYAARYDGPYKGKVVDADTKEPLEDVVVFGVWYSETPTVAGAVSRYYDAQETLTNEKGEFSIITSLLPYRAS